MKTTIRLTAWVLFLTVALWFVFNTHISVYREDAFFHVNATFEGCVPWESPCPEAVG